VTPPPARIEALDVLRGLAVLGILVVNAASFAMPPVVAELPDLSPHGFEGSSVAVWWAIETFFRQKFVTLFSLLFGASILLVGGERGSHGPRGVVLLRRLLWLAVFGFLHGALVWHGDILLLYGLAGLVVMLCRSWRPGVLAAIGLALFAVAAARLLEVEFATQSVPELQRSFEAGAVRTLSAEIAAFRGDSAQLQAALFANWWRATDFTLEFYAPMTLGLMLIGLALFRLGVLTGEAPSSTYWLLMVLGAAALLVIGWNTADQALGGFPPETRAFDELPNLLLAPVVTLGYVALVCLGLRRGWMRGPARLLAPVGRMAFTNYIAQSLIMTAVFYGGGRGLGLFGSLDWAQWSLLALLIWPLQIGWSGWWLSRFRLGPLEWVWRSLSHGRLVPLRLGALERPAVPTT
jgi:uncharacterized protein